MASAVIPNVLTIAGVDPSGGAGVLADIKTISALGAYGCAVIAALTAQNTLGVRGIHAVPTEFVRQQIETLLEDVCINAVKIGMLGTVEIIEAVAQSLERWELRHVVVDPVMVAKSGDPLLMEDAVQCLRTRLLPLATIITPNIPEAAVLLGRAPAVSLTEMQRDVRDLHRLIGGREGQWVMLKGGHLAEGDAIDVLSDGKESIQLGAPRVVTKNTHGTGCTLSSAIAALLPQSSSVPEAVRRAKNYLSVAIQHADRLRVGGGHGPVHHFHAMWQ